MQAPEINDSDEEESEYILNQEQMLKNPILVKMPDGSMRVAAEYYNDSCSNFLCWKCHNKIVLEKELSDEKSVECGSCKATNYLKPVVESERQYIVTCLNCNSTLLVPKDTFHLCCSVCNHIFRLNKYFFYQETEKVNIFEHLS